MRIKVLMVADNGTMPVTDAAMLKARGFMVYTCSNVIVNEMVTEVKPDIVFFNPEDPDMGNTRVYQNLLNNDVAAHIPIIYTLSEDDLYLVHTKHSKRRSAKLLTDNIIEGIKTSLLRAFMPKQIKHISLAGLYQTENKGRLLFG